MKPVKYFYCSICKGNYDGSPCSDVIMIMTDDANLRAEDIVESYKEVDNELYYHIWEKNDDVRIFNGLILYPAHLRLMIRMKNFEYLKTEPDNA